MIAVDTNVLIYACDQADPRRQKVALDLITNTQDGVLLWQVACEFLSASRKLSKQGFTPTARLESPRRVPGSAAARPTDRRQSGARKGTPSCTRSVALGCPHPGGVCRSWRRDLLLRGPAGLRRFRGSRRSSTRSSSTQGAEEGDATPGRGWPPLAHGRLFASRVRRLEHHGSPSRRNPLNERDVGV